MKCPFCGSEDNKVTDTRPGKEGKSVRRRRECIDCGRRFTTYEYVEKSPLVVVKRDGREEPFDRQKLLIGIMTAAHKRPVMRVEIEKIVDEIEEGFYDLGNLAIPSRLIGEEVMKRLKELDEVAYVRFASVYRDFKDKKEFLKEVNGLKNPPEE
ncbi:transcriptional repressor NrdR [candidate division WOR-3 bacterium]|nr:transcriptional repressor NrdR [candidate division WOR-3 bacterium]MCK4575769.1 transcriptional repressor NrdR [candidate division WOR-3 bacterium]